MTAFLTPLLYERVIDLVLADPELLNELEVGWDPGKGEQGREEVRLALGMLDLWSEDHRATIEGVSD